MSKQNVTLLRDILTVEKTWQLKDWEVYSRMFYKQRVQPHIEKALEGVEQRNRIETIKKTIQSRLAIEEKPIIEAVNKKMAELTAERLQNNDLDAPDKTPKEYAKWVLLPFSKIELGLKFSQSSWRFISDCRSIP